MFCALDDRCQSGDEKTKFGAKLQMTWQPLIG